MGLNTKDSYTRVKILCLPVDSQKDKTRKILVWDNFGNFYGFSFYVTIIILPGNDWQILNLFFSLPCKLQFSSSCQLSLQDTILVMQYRIWKIWIMFVNTNNVASVPFSHLLLFPRLLTLKWNDTITIFPCLSKFCLWKQLSSLKAMVLKCWQSCRITWRAC